MINFLMSQIPELSFTDKLFIEKLYRKESKRMWYTANKILQNEEMAKDAVQQTFENMIKKVSLLKSFDCSEKVSAYVFISTRNTANYFLRSQKPTIPLDEAENFLTNSADVELKVLKSMEIEAIKEIVAQINPIYSDAFAMRYFLDMEYADIAVACCLSVDTARKYVSKCRTLLRKSGVKNES